MRIFNQDGELHSLQTKRFEKIRRDHAATLVLDDRKIQALQDALMYLGGICDNHRDYQESDETSVFDDPKVLTDTIVLGQRLYKTGGTALMMRTADELWTIMNYAVRMKQTHHTLFHYEIFIRELDHAWNGIGDTKGAPIIDYWQI